MEVISVPITKLIPDPQNARKHPQKNIDAIVSSLKRFGQVEPLVIQKESNIVIGGNARLSCLRQLNFQFVKVVEMDLNDSDSRALGIALNRSGELSEWDTDTLSDVLQSLDCDMVELGFDEADLKQLKFDLDLDKIDVPTTGAVKEKRLKECPSCGHEF